MNKQLSFSASEYAGNKKATRRERFLGEMEKVVPWGKLIALIEPCYPTGDRGRPPVGIERMLRIYTISTLIPVELASSFGDGRCCHP